MTDTFDERFSALVDGELSDPDTLLSQVAQDEALRARWTRYHVMRDAIDNRLSDIATADISAGVSQAIENEPVIVAPWHQRIRVKPMLKQASGLAVAATIATLAILVVQNTTIKEPATATNIASTSPQTSLKTSLQPAFKTASLAAVKKIPKSRRLDRAVEMKLNNYLVNHNEYSMTSKMRGILPYSRIVSFTPSERIVDDH